MDVSRVKCGAAVAFAVVLGFSTWARAQSQPAANLPEVAAEPLPGLVIPIPGFPIPVTNSLLTAWIAMAVLVLLALWIRNSIQTVPSGKQNAA